MSLFCSWAWPWVAFLAVLAVPAVAEEPLSLETYVEVVVRNHPAAREAGALMRSADAERTATRLLPDPIVEVSRDRARDPDGAGFTETGVAVSQTIPWPGTFAAGVQAGNRAADSFRASAERVRWDLIVTARQSFSALVAARARAEIAQQTEDDARSLRDLMQRRATFGEARESDRIKAEVEWLRQERARKRAEQELQTAESTVRVLAGAELPRPLVLVDDLPSDAAVLDRGALEALVATSPRVVAAHADAARQQALASVARRGRIPNLEVRVFRDQEVDKRATGASIGVRVPLWNGNRGEIARAEASAAVAKSSAEKAVLDAGLELSERLRDIELARSQVTLLTGELLPKAAESLRLARLLFEEGETSLLDLLDAQRTWREAQREAIDARVALATAAAELQRLVGPDFNPWR